MKKWLSVVFVFMITLCSLVNGNVLADEMSADGKEFSYHAEGSNISLNLIARYDSGSDFDEGGAEITTYDPETKRIFSVNGHQKALDIVDGSKIGQEFNLPLIKRVKLSDLASTLGQVSDITSVALHPKGNYLALAVPAEPKTNNGFVVFLDKDGNLLSYVSVGALPDMVTFTPDGKYTLVANEGEPNDDYSINPEGSVAIIDVQGGTEGLTQGNVEIISFDENVIDSNVRKVHPDSTYREDLEPEYIAVDSKSQFAYVVLQENNAIAKLDIQNKKFVSVKSLGFKDHSKEDNGLDASNKDNKVNIKSWPVLGMYQPDGMAIYEVNGKTYLVTPNEGDAQDYDNFSEEKRVKDLVDSYKLNAELFDGFTQQQLDEMIANGLFNEDQLGRLKTTTSAPKNENGKYEAIYGFGARSFSIFDAETMNLIFDSGDDFEQITSKALPDYFNSSNDENKKDDRSDDKGPEPEAVVVGTIDSKNYAFIGLERIGGIIVYDVTNPSNPKFETYVNSRDFSSTQPGGDVAPEGLKFVAANQSPTGKPILIVGNEVSGTVSVYEAVEKAKTKTITILHTNDSHARVFEGKYDGMGFAKLATLIDQLRLEKEHTLLLDAGDTFHGTTFATLEQGSSIVKIMNKIGYDAMAAGNHDFNYGYKRLLELSGMTNFPVISANVIYEDTGELVLPPYTIKTINGVKLGIFGLSTPETHFKTHPKNVEGLKFTDPVEAARKMVSELKAQNVDVIIALTHLGTDASSTETSIKVAEGAPGIDLIVDGHSHTVDDLENSGTLIVSAGEYLKNLGVVELTFDENNKLIDREATRITKEEAQDVTPHTDVEALINEIQSNQEKILSEEIGTTNVKLDGERELVRTGETNLGNLITDVMLEVTGADVAITNGGGIRASIDKGPITKGEVITVLPFGNYIQTMEVPGKVIKEALENGVSAYPEPKGAFPHVAGMTFAIDPNKPAGERVHSVKVNGKPLDMKETYTLATNDFLAAGGDEYTMFEGYKTNDFPALDEAVIHYIQKVKTVEPKVEGRIVIAETPSTNNDSKDDQNNNQPDNSSNNDKQTDSKIDVQIKDGKATIKTEELNRVKDHTTLELDIQKETNVELQLSEEQVKKIKEKGLSIKMYNEDVSVVIPGANLPDGKVEVHVERMKDIENAVSAVYDFTITSNGQTYHKFNENMILEFKVTKKVKNPENVKVYYYNEETKKWDLIGGTYEDGVVIAITDHFSTFAAFEVDSEENEQSFAAPESGYTLPKTSTNSFNFLLIGFILVAGGVSYFIYKRRKQLS